MVSKFDSPDSGRYLVDWGASENLLGVGILGSVHQVNHDGFCLVSNSGVTYEFLFDVNSPSVVASERTQQWRKLAFDCYGTCAPIRLINATHIEGNRWAMTEESFALRQSKELMGSDIKAFRMFEVRNPDCQWVNIHTVTDHVLEPVIPVKCAMTVDTKQLMEAETKLHPCRNSCRVRQADPGNFEVTAESRHVGVGIEGVLVCWPSGCCCLPIQPHQILGDWEIQGKRCSEVTWIDGEGSQWNPNQIVFGHDVFFTDYDFEWPMVARQNQVFVVHVLEHSCRGQWISFSEAQTVADLMAAEQILQGPSHKISHVHDQNASKVDRWQRLERHTALAIHWRDASTFVHISIQHPDRVQDRSATKGTRLFQVVPVDADTVIVDADDYILPWDLPIFRSFTVRIIPKKSRNDTERDLTPTVEFIAEPNPVDAVEKPRNEMRDLVREQTVKMTEHIKRIADLFPKQTQSPTYQRLKMLCEEGPRIGDDEMSFHLDMLSMHHEIRTLGIFEWNSVMGDFWKINDRWERGFHKNMTYPCVVMLSNDNHWIPVILRAYDVVEYWDSQDLGQSHVQHLMQVLKMQPGCRVVRFPTEIHKGFCGFQALAQVYRSFNESPNQQDMTASMVSFFDGSMNLDIQRYEEALSRCNDPAIIAFASDIRPAFICQMMQSPTCPLYHAGGHDDKQSHAQLKLTGCIASVLIAKGHASEEAVKIAQRLVKLSPPKLKGLSGMPENKAYTYVLEACVGAGIEMANLSQQQAVKKLQQFFRSQQKKKSVQEVDISQIQFLPRTWMIQNGEYVEVQPAWSPVNRGIACATEQQISEYAGQAKLLSKEANTAITIKEVKCSHPIVCEAVVVPVTDGKGGRALIRLHLTHFGAKKIVKVPVKNATVDLPACKTLSVTTFREHSDDVFWHQLIQAPVKSLLSLLRTCPQEMPILQVWPRRWGNGTGVVEPHVANTFSFLASIPADDVQKWLLQSGLTSPPVFVSTKRDGTENPDDSHRILWCGKNISHAVAAQTKVEQHLGIVFKMPGSFGLRVKSSQFQEAWKALRETDEAPTHVMCKLKFILAALPNNITGQAIEKWGEAVGWQVKVLKRFHDNRFLIGSPVPPPHEQLSLNGSDVLVQQFQEATKPTQLIVAGKLASNAQSSTSIDDPWLGKKLGGQQKPSRDASEAWGGYVPTNRPNVGRPEIAEDVTHNNERINKVEQDIAQLREQMQASQASTQSQLQQMDSKIGAMGHSLKLSLQEALAEQSSSLIKTFEHLIKSPKSRSGGKEDGNRSRSPKSKAT